MKGKVWYMAIVAVVAILLIGEVTVYTDVYRSDSELILDSDGYGLVMDTNYSIDYLVMSSYSEVNSSPREFLIYRDVTYGSYLEDSYLDHTIRCFEDEFRIYNFMMYRIVDAAEVAEVLSGDLESKDASSHALLFLSGVLPDTIYGDSELLEDWLALGGSVYWSGSTFGRYVAHPRSSENPVEEYDTDPGDRFLGVSGGIGTSKSDRRGSDPSADRYIGDALNMFYDNCNYGVRSDVPDSLFIGYESEGYNSVSVCRYAGGTGQICIFGGRFPPSDMQTGHSNIIKVFISNISYDSVFFDIIEGHKGSGSIGVQLSDDLIAGSVVYVYYGSMLGTYACAHRI